MAKRTRTNRYTNAPAPASIEPMEEAEVIENPEEPKKMTLLEAVEALAREIRGICMRTKLSENTVLALFSFQWQQIERERMGQMAGLQGQAAIDAIAAEQAAKAEGPREADEVITSE